MDSPSVLRAVAPPHAPLRDQNDPLLRVARDLEASFLSEMLKHAGLGQSPDAFGGGAGEEQFSSLLRDAQADAIARRGGIGLAENIYQALKESIDAT